MTLVAPDIHRFALRTSLPVGDVNVYLLTGEPLTLVDTGPDAATVLVDLERCLDQVGHRVEDIELVVLTHEHADHVGLANVVAGRSRARVAAFAGAADAMGEYAQSCAKSEAALQRLLERHGTPSLHARASRAYMRALNLWGASVDVDQPLHDGSVLEAGGRRWRVHHRPGHSASDTVLIDEEDGLLLAGDHLLRDISTIAAMVSGPGEEGAAESGLLTLRRSLQETAALGARVAYGGHGEAIDDPGGLVRRRLAEQDERAGRILTGLSTPRTAYEVAAELFGRDRPHAACLTVTEVLGHLELLVDQGVARMQIEHGVARFCAP